MAGGGQEGGRLGIDTASLKRGPFEAEVSRQLFVIDRRRDVQVFVPISQSREVVELSKFNRIRRDKKGTDS